MSKHSLRRTNFVDKAVQGALVRRVIFHWLTFIGTSVATVSILQIILGDPEKSLSEHLASAWKQYALLAMVLLALLPAFVLDTIRMSARFAGPVHRLRQNFRAVADGQPHVPLRFRDKDFWSELADDFNRMMERVGKNPSAVQAINEVRDAEEVEQDEDQQVAPV